VGRPIGRVKKLVVFEGRGAGVELLVGGFGLRRGRGGRGMESREKKRRVCGGERDGEGMTKRMFLPLTSWRGGEKTERMERENI
jgi:hypothetical protein